MPSVGHFRSDAAREHFFAAYDAAMAALPPSEPVDVPTSFGTVRTYRFSGPAAGAPVVLLPGRNASTPMWGTNLADLLTRRPVIGIDLLGEPGRSVQTVPITGPDDEARWLDETLAGLAVDSAHLMGVSIGGWTAVNHAVRRPGRAASLVVLDPVFTFAPIAAKAVLASPALFLPGVPKAVRRRVLSWISGGAEVTDLPETALISAGSTDYVLAKPMPRRFGDDELQGLGIPVLALIAGRSVMHDGARAAARAQQLLPHGQVELWAAASHAINGEYQAEIATRAHRFWAEVDSAPT
ncbi:alpha/beta fold hydrolase [Mycolicibacterium sp. XJ1819]